jgi:hypothetical protein
MITVTFYVISYIMMASSANVGVYAGGAVLYAVGQSGTQVCISSSQKAVKSLMLLTRFSIRL